MRKFATPQAVVPGVMRRIDPATLMPVFDKRGCPLWDMPAPISYAEHKQWRRHKRTDKRVAEVVMVPIYRGTAASYARWVKAQLRRQQRENEAEKNLSQEAEATFQDLVLKSGDS